MDVTWNEALYIHVLLDSQFILPSVFFLFWLLFFHFYSSVAGAFEMLSIKVGSVAYWVGYFGWCASKLSKIGSSLEAERLQKSSPSSLLMPSWPRGFYLLMSCRLSARLLEQMSHRVCLLEGYRLHKETLTLDCV